MTVDVHSAIVINRPISEVSRSAADPANAPLWYVNITSVEWVTPPPAQVGSRIPFVAHFLRRRLAYTYEIVAFVPGMTLRKPRHPCRILGLGCALMAIAMRGANRKDLARPKKRLERIDV